MVPASIGRARLEDMPDGLRIAVPSRWNWFTFLVGAVLTPFILLWVLLDLRSKPFAIAITFLMWLIFFPRVWVWNLAGKEIIYLSRDTLSVHYSMLGVGWTFRYRLSGVSNFRYGAPFHSRYGSENRTIVFDYEYMPRRFGLYLSESEANQLIAVLRTRIPKVPFATSEAKVPAQTPV
jgi:hypothetical protein